MTKKKTGKKIDLRDWERLNPRKKCAGFWGHNAEIAGLGLIAAPVVHDLYRGARGKKEVEGKMKMVHHGADLAGLGILAAPYVSDALHERGLIKNVLKHAAFAAGFKEAAQEEIEKRPSTLGTAALGVGGLAAGKAAIPRVTGRTTYYHGTTKSVADKIREQGLLPSAKGGSTGVIQQGNFPKEWADKAYVAGSKLKALGYAAQADALRPAERGREVLKISLPEWKHPTEANPETKGSYKEWKQRTIERVRKQQGEAGVRALEAQPTRILYAAQKAGNERAIDYIPSSYIKGSKNYKRLGLKEVGEYIKARPGRFASGVGLGALGLGALGLTGHRVYKHFKQKPTQND